MLLKKSKILIYILLFLLILNFVIPICSFAIDEDSIYVWSNHSSTISTSSTSTEKIENSTSQNNSRKFFRNYFRWGYINRAKYWNCFI